MAYDGENAWHSEGNHVSYPVDVSQTIEKGDFLKPNAAGDALVVCAATNDSVGVALASIITDASGNVLDDCSNIMVGVTAVVAVQEQGMIWAKVDTTSEIKIGDALELNAVDELVLQSGGSTVAYAKEYVAAAGTPTNGTGYLSVVLSPGFR